MPEPNAPVVMPEPNDLRIMPQPLPMERNVDVNRLDPFIQDRDLALQELRQAFFGRGEEMKKEMKDGKRGEELFALILSGIREIYNVDAVIAGGAVRDLASGYDNYKDVDVFIPLKKDEFLFAAEELGWSGKVVPVPMKDYKGQGTGPFVSNGRAASRVQGVSVDLVFLNEPLSPKVVEGWPVYAQRCIWTLEKGLTLSPEAKADIEAKQFTINPAITDKHRVKEILVKVNDWKTRPHYKDWKVIEPETKEWWESKKENEKAQKEKKTASTDDFKWLLKDNWWINP